MIPKTDKITETTTTMSARRLLNFDVLDFLFAVTGISPAGCVIILHEEYLASVIGCSHGDFESTSAV
jgi:hypothetical protein